MAFKTVILCEKQKQVKFLKSGYKLNKTKSFNGVVSAHYDREDGLCVVGLSGHLLELAPPEFYESSLRRDKAGWNIECLPVIPDGERWKLVPKKGHSAKETKRIKGLLGGIEWAFKGNGQPGEICIAVDNDKEGELLGWETLEYFGLADHPNKTRMLYSQISEKAMMAAFDGRGDAKDWYTRYLAGLARLYADWLIGMNVTIAMSVDNKGMIPPYQPLNSGRVVFAICYLLYRRDLDIKNFKPQNYYREKVQFKSDGGNYFGRLIYPTEHLDPELKELKDKDKADKYHRYIKSKGQGEIVRYDEDRKKTAPPVGFHRTGLDRHMVRKFGLSLDEVDKALQALYDEKGLATYPRVDVKNLDVGMHAEMPPYLSAMAQNMSKAPQLSDKEKELYQKAFKLADLDKKSPIWKKGIADGESHHAIISTDTVADMGSLTRNEFLIYRELVDRLLVQFLPDYEYASTIIETKVGSLICKTSGTVPLRKGWKGLSQDMEEVADENDDGALPKLKLGQQVSIIDSQTTTHTTTVPSLYTVDNLLGDLENPKKFVENKELMKSIKKLQIGTDGTRQGHVTSLETKNLVDIKPKPKSKKVKELHPTQKLIAIMEIAPNYFKLPEVSAYWEDASNEIQAGNMSLGSFLAKQKKLINRFFTDLRNGNFKLKSPISDNVHKCPSKSCQGYLFLRALKGKDFKVWSCGGCGDGYIDNDGKLGNKLGQGGSSGPRPDWVPPKGTARSECPDCNKKTAYHKKLPDKDWSMWTCLECKSSFFDDKGKVGKKMRGKK